MDKTDEMILDLMKGNARISYQKPGDAVGMSRAAAKKRVRKLEQEGIIRGYNTYIHREDQITLLIDIVTVPNAYDTSNARHADRRIGAECAGIQQPEESRIQYDRGTGPGSIVRTRLWHFA